MDQGSPSSQKTERCARVTSAHIGPRIRLTGLAHMDLCSLHGPVLSPPPTPTVVPLLSIFLLLTFPGCERGPQSPHLEERTTCPQEPGLQRGHLAMSQALAPCGGPQPAHRTLGETQVMSPGPGR